MINGNLYQCLVLIVLPFCLLAATTPEMEDPLLHLYKKYQVAYTGSKGISLRRFLKNNNEYQNHVKRLKDVNGFKSHNIALRNGDQPDVNKTMYVNNPVEAKLPQAFISFDEFKQALVDRVEKDKDALKKSNIRALISKRWIVTTKRTKRRPTRTIKIEDVFKRLNDQNREPEDRGPNLENLQLMQTNKTDRIKYTTRTLKGQSRESQKRTPANSKSIKRINNDVNIKHTIKIVQVPSRGPRNITAKHSNFTKKKKTLKKGASNFFKLGDSGPILSDSVQDTHITVGLKAQSREPDIITNPAKHVTYVKITQKQNKKNIDVKIMKSSQNMAHTVIESIIKDQIQISPISDYKEHKMSAKDADARLANGFYLRAKGTTVENVTETITESKTDKKLESTVEMEMTTKALSNSVSTKSTVTNKLVNATKSTVSTLFVESETVTNVADSTIREIESTTNLTETATKAKEVAINVIENAENATDLTKAATTELESMSSETEEEEEQDETEASTTIAPTTTTVLTQRTLGRPRVFMGR